MPPNKDIQFSLVQLLSHVRLFVTPWTAARQASLSITNSQSLLKLISIESVMPSNHLILSSPSPPAFHLSQHQDLFQCISSSHEVAKVLEFQLQHQSFQWISGMISFRMEWLNLLAVQGTLKNLLQHHKSKASILWPSAFFIVQLSQSYMSTGKTIALTIWIFDVHKLNAFIHLFNKCILITSIFKHCVICQPKKIFCCHKSDQQENT